jgi:hypothetical protein
MMVLLMMLFYDDDGSDPLFKGLYAVDAKNFPEKYV